VGEKRYDDPADARRYADVFNRRDGEAVGRRFSPSLLPLWLGRQAAGSPSGRSGQH
jgi:hypothetical protein